MSNAVQEQPGRIFENIIHFSRALRAAGVRIGPAQTLDAMRAAEATKLASKPDLYWSLRACLARRPEEIEIFDRLFAMFWRNPELEKTLMAAFSPEMQNPQTAKPKSAERRAREAMQGGPMPPRPRSQEESEDIRIDASFSWSANERLAQLDFEQMSIAEMREAAAAIARMEMPARPIASRRLAPAPRGARPDWRASMRDSLRIGAPPRLRFQKPTERAPDLVALCDVSGSMSRYSRMLLMFLHAAAHSQSANWRKVRAFTFGTRLTNITKALAAREADSALELAGRMTPDWEGGTRIGACLRDFNVNWSRRVLGQGAVVLLVTDGLDRDDPDLLAQEAGRLGRSCRDLIWLNPLLRWDGFAPKARGVQALMPHVSSFRAAHNLNALSDLAQILSGLDDGGLRAQMLREMRKDEAA